MPPYIVRNDIMLLVLPCERTTVISMRTQRGSSNGRLTYSVARWASPLKFTKTYILSPHIR